MYSIIQKIYEKNNKILKEGLKKVLSGEDVSSLTVAIKEFTYVLGKELFSEIAKQLDEIIFEDNKKKKQYEPVRFQEKSLITKNGKTKFERRYYKDKETGEYLYLTDAVLGIDKGERIDKKVKSEVIERANDQSYNKSGVEWIEKSVFVLDLFHLEKYINHLNYDEYLKSKLQEAIDQYDPISTENIMNEAINKIKQEIKEDEELRRNTKRLKNRLKKIENTKTYLMNQWSGIEAHDKYKDKLTGCCQEGQVHHTLSERMSTDAKVWCENGIDEMSQLRAFTQNGGSIYQKIIDISTKEKNKKIEALEKRIRKKANKKLFGTTGVSIPTLSGARDELYYELKNTWYGKAA